MKIITVTCYAVCLLLIATWLAIEMQFCSCFFNHRMSLGWFIAGSMLTFAPTSWLILSTPYWIFRFCHPEAKDKLPSYWQYMRGNKPTE
jgi:hypothetical protein